MKTNSPQKKASIKKTNMIGEVGVFGELKSPDYYRQKWGDFKTKKDTPESRAMKTATIRSAVNKQNKKK